MVTDPDPIYRKQNDTASSIEDRLLDDNGNPVDITGFQSVSIHIWEINDGTVVVDDDDTGNVTVTAPGNGEVKYDLQTGDLASATTKYYEWEVVFSDGTIETFPNHTDGIELHVVGEGA